MNETVKKALGLSPTLAEEWDDCKRRLNMKPVGHHDTSFLPSAEIVNHCTIIRWPMAVVGLRQEVRWYVMTPETMQVAVECKDQSPYALAEIAQQYRFGSREEALMFAMKYGRTEELRTEEIAALWPKP